MSDIGSSKLVTIQSVNKINAQINSTSTILNTTIVPNIGAKGDSAYDIWLKEGNEGTVQDFLNRLRGQSFVYEQIASLDTWIIVHNLGKYPSVTVVDTGGNIVIGNVNYVSPNEIIISFSSDFSGKAYLN